MERPRRLIEHLTVIAAAVALAPFVSACSTSMQTDTAALTASQPTPSATGGYVLSKEEQDLDCKKLTGRMQVRILQVRNIGADETPSLASHAIQTAAVTAGSGATRGLDTTAERAKDMAELKAYNARLGELGCKTFNLDEELKPKDFRQTPQAANASNSRDGEIKLPISSIGAKPTKPSN